MKIKLDTEQKTIQVESNVNLGELISSLRKLLPNGVWKEFELKPQIIDNTVWQNPIIIKEKQYIERCPHENFPWYYQNTSGTVDMDNKMLCTAENSSQTEFNIEIE